MVFSSFNTHLGFENNQLTQGDFIVVSGQNIDGNFLMHHFISQYAKNKGTASILGFAQTLTHYSNVGHKLGVNLTNMVKEQSLHFIDGLTLILDAFSKGTSENVLPNPGSTDSTLKQLWKLIRNDISSFTDGVPHLFIIDDITALINIGFSVQEVFDFVHYCKSLSEKHKTSFLIGCHENEEDEDYSLIESRLQQYATMKIHVQALKTGYSKDLSGEMQIFNFRNVYSSSMKTLHFKLMDRDVRFFAPGTSTAVL